MITALVSSMLAFISTNIDDIFILMLFFSVSASEYDRMKVVLGQYSGLGLLFVFSLLISAGLAAVFSSYVWILGFVPLVLGIKAWMCRNDEEEEGKEGKISLFNVMAVTVSGGADNVGIYIPLFSSYGKAEILTAAIVFILMTGLLCFGAYMLASIPVLKERIARYRKVLVPFVFTALGLFIISDGIFF